MMKRKQCAGSLWIALLSIMLVIFISCHPSKSLKTSPADAKPAVSDSSSQKIDTGPSEFFDGAYINIKYSGARMQDLHGVGATGVVPVSRTRYAVAPVVYNLLFVS